ncbi:hypothetical protein Rs2_18101 [Raphanus sativus]|nr:hypothetical protein Rs2_18101 [Raphanus sativus]
MVELLLYAPTRPAVDFTAGLLLLMAVGTVVVGSLWSELTDPDQANESYNILSKELSSVGTRKDDPEKEILDISVHWCCVLYSNSLNFPLAAFLLHVIMVCMGAHYIHLHRWHAGYA